ncbi:MAG: hypothetical protein ACSHW0_15220 [Thalassotalea sp.]
MLRWLGAVIILLGWLLQNNESQTRALIATLAKAKPAKSSSSHSFDFNGTEQQRNRIIKSHLACTTDQQCTLVMASNLSTACFIAVNKVSAAKLKSHSLA